MDNNFQPSPLPNEIEANNYDGTLGHSVGSQGEEVISQVLPDLKSNLAFDGNASVLFTGAIQNKDYKMGSRGFKLRNNGTVEINEGTFISKQAVTTTHFYKVLTDATTGISLWMGDGTTANGALTGVAGDVLLNGGSHKPEYCSVSGTTWVALV